MWAGGFLRTVGAGFCSSNVGIIQGIDTTAVIKPGRLL
jgi:hypothetical protein